MQLVHWRDGVKGFAGKQKDDKRGRSNEYELLVLSFTKDRSVLFFFVVSDDISRIKYFFTLRLVMSNISFSCIFHVLCETNLGCADKSFKSQLRDKIWEMGQLFWIFLKSRIQACIHTVVLTCAHAHVCACVKGTLWELCMEESVCWMPDELLL